MISILCVIILGVGFSLLNVNNQLLSFTHIKHLPFIEDIFGKDVLVIEKEYNTSFKKFLKIDFKTGGNVKLSGWNREKIYTRITLNKSIAQSFVFSISGKEDELKMESGFNNKNYNKMFVQYEIKLPWNMFVSIISEKKMNQSIEGWNFEAGLP